jgi:imidazoleglycerol phosphate synthase glutamine amidotransferase subunit HisH
VHSGNIIGCQFHPEKSGKAGLAFLKKFLEK